MTEEQRGAAPEPLREPPRFTGSGSEYFRIWIVNVFLTLLTLGVYAAWAKVRTRRYFYRATLLAGQPFDYLANPLAILRGNLLVFGALALYGLAEQGQSAIAVLVLALAYAALPYLVWKSLRFYAHNSSFRNLRFGFRGTLGEAYLTWLLLPALIPFTLGLIVPYWHFRRKRLALDNFTYGKTISYFGGRPGYFYRSYALAGLLGLSLPVAAGLLFALRGFWAGPAADAAPWWFGGVAVAGAVAGVTLVVLVQQVLYARLTNYAWAETRLGPVRFESTLGVWPLTWIAVTNTLATLLTLGLFFPWARVRKTRYLLANLTVVSAAGLDGFLADAEPEESALGDSAVDFFDLEIGL